MDDGQEQNLDQQVAEVLAELQQSGETTSVETVARKVGRRTETVLQAIRRVTGGGHAPPDHATPPEQYPEVLASARKVETITAALQDAEGTLQARERLLVRAEAAAAEALLDGREPLSGIEARQAVLDAADMVRLLARAQTIAKSRHAEALAQAQAQQRARQWTQYQATIRALIDAGDQFVLAQDAAMQAWNEVVNQHGEAPKFRGSTEIWTESFRAFLLHITRVTADEIPPSMPPTGGQPRAY